MVKLQIVLFFAPDPGGFMSQYDSEGLKLLPIDEYMNIFQAAPDVITKQPPTQVDTCPI